MISRYKSIYLSIYLSIFNIQKIMAICGLQNQSLTTTGLDAHDLIWFAKIWEFPRSRGFLQDRQMPCILLDNPGFL